LLPVVFALAVSSAVASADPPNPNGSTPAPGGIGSGKRVYVTEKFSVTIEGIAAATFQRFEGGDVAAEVVTAELGGDHLTHKHLGNVKYNDIRFVDGVDEKNLFCTWWATRRLATPNPGVRVAGSPAPMYVVAPKNLEIVALDEKGKEVRRLTVYNAVPTKLLADCRGTAGTTIHELVLQPEMTRWTTVKP